MLAQVHDKLLLEPPCSLKSMTSYCLATLLAPVKLLGHLARSSQTAWPPCSLSQITRSQPEPTCSLQAIRNYTSPPHHLSHTHSGTGPLDRSSRAHHRKSVMTFYNTFETKKHSLHLSLANPIKSDEVFLKIYKLFLRRHTLH